MNINTYIKSKKNNEFIQLIQLQKTDYNTILIKQTSEISNSSL